METRVGPPLLAIALLLLASPVAAGEDHLAAAKGIGEYLLDTARKQGDGVYWAQYEGPGPAAHGEELHFPVSLYSGAAGTGYFLLNLHRATGDERYLEAAKGVGLRLIEIAKPIEGGGIRWEASYERRGRSIPEGTGLGLYVGNAGIGLFLAYLHEATGDARFLKAAKAAFARVLAEAVKEGDGLHWKYGALDIISGEAGIGLALLEMHRLTGDRAYRKAANKAATWLVARADREGGHVRWERNGWHDHGFSHGASGIAFFLSVVDDEKAEAAAGGAARWIESVAEPCGEGDILWTYYSGSTPPKGKTDWVFNGWCHGAPGTIRLFLLHHRTGGDPRDLAAAVKGGGGILHSASMTSKAGPFYYNPTYCCGAAGCIDAFLDLHRATGEARWLESARTLADDVIGKFRKRGKWRVHATYDDSDKEKDHPYVGTSFMKGNAGIGHVLLRLALLEAEKPGKMLHLPDQPFSPLGDE